MNGTAASVITGATVVISATVAACLHVLDGAALASVYTAVLAGGIGYKLGTGNGGN